jgi:hypothetical protein
MSIVLTFSTIQESPIVIVDGKTYFVYDGQYYLPNSSFTVLTSVSSSITSISNSTFINLTELISVSLSSSITSIGTFAFYQCYNLASVTLPSTITVIPQGCFGYCNLSSINIPSTVTSINSAAFTSNPNLLTVTFNGNNLTFIGISAFQSCTSLTNITFPTSLQTIDDGAFFNCNLTSISIPAATTTIGTISTGNDGSTGVFNRNDNLVSITVNASNPNYSSLNNVLYSKNKTTLFQYPLGLPSTSFTLPSTVTTIYRYAFAGAPYLTSVTLSNVQRIFHSAFAECNYITSFTIPTTVQIIYNQAFINCTGVVNFIVTEPNNFFSNYNNDGVLYDNTNATILYYPAANPRTTYSIPPTVRTINQSTFFNANNLTSINYISPSLLTTLNAKAFWTCTNLVSISLPNTITSIGSDCFFNCTDLTTINIPENASLKSILFRTFTNCSSLTSITIPSNITTLGKEAFSYTGLTSVTIPATLTSIDSTSFHSCLQLTSFTVNASNPNYSNDATGALYNKTKTILYQYPLGLTNTFYNLPTTVTTLGKSSFSYSPHLTTVIFLSPSSLTLIDGTFDTNLGSTYGAFKNATGLTSLTIPTTVANIGGANPNQYSYAFYECTNLEFINFQTNTVLTSLKDYTFYGCTNLTTIYLSPNISSLGVSCFYNCTNLKVFQYSLNGISTLKNNCFAGTTALDYIIIPSSSNNNVTDLTSIGNSTVVANQPNSIFQVDTSQLQTVIHPGGNTIMSNIIESNSKSFQSKSLKAASFTYTIYVSFDLPPSNTLWQWGSGWVSLSSTTFYSTLVDNVPANQFNNNPNLSGISLLQVVFGKTTAGAFIKTIGSYAFYNTKLVNVTIPYYGNGTSDTLTISDYAFGNCINLNSVVFDVLSATIQTKIILGQNVFSGSGKLFLSPVDYSSNGGSIFINFKYSTSNSGINYLNDNIKLCSYPKTSILGSVPLNYNLINNQTDFTTKYLLRVSAKT